MSLYAPWTLSTLTAVARRELMDPNKRWWSDAELAMYASEWQNELQRDYEFTWGSATIITASNTILLSSITPAMDRLDAVYYGTGTSSGYRLAGRLIQDLEILQPEWRSDLQNIPRAVVQYDSTQMVVWPPLSTLGTFIFEYPQRLALSSTPNIVQLPVWTQWSAKSYICQQAYLRPGPVNDVRKANRYAAQYAREKQRIKLLWDNQLPERFRRLKPAGHYEWDILKPPPAWDTGTTASALNAFHTFVLAPDNVSLVFILPVTATPKAVQVFINGLLMAGEGVDYSWSGNIITFNIAPRSTDVVVVWTFT